MPECNIIAMIHEFPSLAIYQSSGLTESVDRLDPPAAAILIDEMCLAEMSELDQAVLRSPRQALTAVVVEDSRSLSPATAALVASRHVHSILPMNLRLETWLLAVRLLLKGGEFMPTSMARFELPVARPRTQERARNNGQSAVVSRLTDRELQVLHMIANGSPNRTIADRFSVSEHTVKMHVHNLIRKLKVPNRTAAAAIYLESMGKPVGSNDASFVLNEGA